MRFYLCDSMEMVINHILIKFCWDINLTTKSQTDELTECSISLCD